MKIKIMKFISLCNGLVFYASVALFIRTSHGISVSGFFVLQMILSLGIMVLEMPTGVLGDKLGYRRSVVLSQWVLLLARILLWCSGTFWMFALEALVEALAGSLMSGTYEAYIYQDGSEEYASKTARISNWGTIGFLLSTILYVPMMKLGGLNMLLAATAVAASMSALATLFLPKGKEQVKESTSVRKEKRIKGKAELKLLMKEIVLFSLVDSILSICYMGVNFFYAAKLDLNHFGSEWIAIVIIGYSVVQLATPWALDKVERMPRDGVPVFLSLAAGGLFFFLFFADGMLVLLPMLLIPLVLSIYGIILSKTQNLFIDSIDRQEARAFILSTFSMGTNFCDVGFLSMSAVMSQWSGEIVFAVSGVAVLTIPAVLNMIKKDVTLRSPDRS